MIGVFLLLGWLQEVLSFWILTDHVVNVAVWLSWRLPPCLQNRALSFVNCVIATSTGENLVFFLFCSMLDTDDIVCRNICAMLTSNSPGASRVVFDLWRPPLKC